MYYIYAYTFVYVCIMFQAKTIVKNIIHIHNILVYTAHMSLSLKFEYPE